VVCECDQCELTTNLPNIDYIYLPSSRSDDDFALIKELAETDSLFLSADLFRILPVRNVGDDRIPIYSNKQMERSWTALEYKFKFKFIQVQTFGDKEVVDLHMITDCYGAVTNCSLKDYLHVIVVSADKDFHNLFTELRSFGNVRTHSLSAQSGSSLAALANYALEMEKIYTPRPHIASPSKKKKQKT
jgi:hypothetical protein